MSRPAALVCLAQDPQQRASDLAEANDQHRCLGGRLRLDGVFR